MDIEHAAHPSLIRRFMAILYDSLLVFGLLLFGSLLVTLPLGLATGADTTQLLAKNPLFQLWLALIPPAFFIHFWRKGGQTLGMRSWRLRVVRNDGAPLTAKDALLRLLAALLSWLPLGVGFLWALWDRDGLTWHDRLSGTRLVLLQKR